MNKVMSSRTRWHGEEASAHRLAQLRTQARNRINDAADPNLKPKNIPAIGLHLVRDCDLRATLQEKSLSVHMHCKWTAFINRAGTLVHLVPRDGDCHVRLPLFYSIAGMHDKRIESLLWKLMEGRFS